MTRRTLLKSLTAAVACLALPKLGEGAEVKATYEATASGLKSVSPISGHWQWTFYYGHRNDGEFGLIESHGEPIGPRPVATAK